jgi:ribonuclease P protein component
MITATHRFHGRSALRFVYQRGKTVRGGELSLRYAYNDRIAGYRVAVVASRKVSKSAVVRNRIRRRIYEIVRLEGERITKPYDLVFTVYNEAAAKLAHKRLSETVIGCLERAGVLEAGGRIAGDFGSAKAPRDEREHTPSRMSRAMIEKKER